MEALDGNAIAGLLAEVFGTEMTGAVHTCAACGATGPMARTLVYRQAPGTVVRCRECKGVLLVIVAVRGMNCIDVSGLAELEVSIGA